jgi:hypothetical protein
MILVAYRNRNARSAVLRQLPGFVVAVGGG